MPGELLTVPGSALAQWMTQAEKVVLIDGCFLHCHGRVLENLVGRETLAQFDAHSYYRRYNENFDIDEVPEEQRKAAARLVADAVLAELRKATRSTLRPERDAAIHRAGKCNRMRLQLMAETGLHDIKRQDSRPCQEY